MEYQPEPKIYNRLAALRTQRAMSRHELAHALGIDYQTLGYLELGKINPSLELALRISEFFGLSVETIFSRNPFQPSNEELHGRLM